MTKPDYVTERQIAHNLLGILQHFAPTGKEQEDCAEMLREMERDGLEYTEIIAAICGMINSGIQYGNWPWTVANVPSELSVYDVPPVAPLTEPLATGAKVRMPSDVQDDDVER